MTDPHTQEQTQNPEQEPVRAVATPKTTATSVILGTGPGLVATDGFHPTPTDDGHRVLVWLTPTPHKNGNRSQQPAMVNPSPGHKPTTPPHRLCCRTTKRNRCRWCITPALPEPKPRNTPRSSPVNSAVNTKPCPTSQWTNISKEAASTTPKNAHQTHQQSKQTEATLRRRSLTGLWMSTDLIDPMLKRRLLRRCRLWWHCMKLISLSEAATNSPPARCLGQRAGQLLPLAVNTKQDLPALAK